MKNKILNSNWFNHSMQFLVVISGILIAFQLNKCSAEDQQRETVEIHLEQIRLETEFNKKSIESSLVQTKSNISKLDTVLSLIDQKKNFERINRLSLELLNIGGVYIRKNAYLNLVETGDIRFMLDFNEKQKIINLYEFYIWVEAFDEISNNLYLQDYYPYLKNNFDFVKGQIQDEEIYQTNLFKNILSAYQRTSSNRAQKYQDSLDEIDNYLSSKD